MSRDRLALRAYGSLLHLYPRRFREEYGADMVLLVRDQLRDRPASPVIARTAVDLAISIPAQHLEGHMRTPTRLVPLFFLAVAAAGLALAIVGGSAPASLVIGLLIALGAGAIGAYGWRQTTHVRASTVTGGWWKFLLAGPTLVAVVILAAGAGVEAWFLGVVTVLVAAACTALGITLGLGHLIKSHVRGAGA